MNFLDYSGMILIFAIGGYIGYASMKKIKKSEDFLLASRDLNRGQAALSLVASEFGGGGLIGACAACYSLGLSGIWWNWAAVVPFILVGIYIAPKLRELRLCTVPEYFEKRYNKKSRVFSTIMQIIATVPGITAQLTVASVALVTLTGWDYKMCITIATVFVLFYTLVGGFIAEVANDVFLFFVIIISITLTMGFALSDVGGLEVLVNKLPDNFLDFGANGFWEPFSWVLLCLFDYATSQYVVQRAFSARNPKTARFAFIFTGCSFIVMGAIVAVIGLCASVLLPGLDDPNQSYSLLASTHLPRGIAGLALGGIVAAAFSTVDSSLMSTTTLFINDIYKPFINKDASEKRLLFVSRIVIIVSCLVAMVISHLTNNIIDLVYVSGLFYGAAVFFPLILGMFWKTTKANAAFASMITAVLFGCLSEFAWYGKVDGIFGLLPSNFVSAVSGLAVLIIFSVIQKKVEENEFS